MSQVAQEMVWFTGKPAADYLNQSMEQSLTPEQCNVVKEFFQHLIMTRAQTSVSVSRFMYAYRKERNGSYYHKTRRL